MRRRHFILGFLLLGMVVNITVAWASAIWIDCAPLQPRHPSQIGVSEPEDKGWELVLLHTPTSTFVSFWPSATRRLPPSQPHEYDPGLDYWLKAHTDYEAGRPLPLRENVTVVEVPAWSRTANFPDLDKTRDHFYLEFARGWPMRSLVSYWDKKVDFETWAITWLKPTWRFDLNGKQGPVGLPRGLPYRVIPLGFTFNSLLYASMLWMIVQSVLIFRRSYRLRRGLCSKCAYNLRGADHVVCPECGANLVNVKSA